MFKKNFKFIVIGIYFLFVIFSFIYGFNSGEKLGKSFLDFAMPIFKIMPFIFILVALFEVWVKREIIEKHFGEESGVKGFVWAILLSTTTVLSLYSAFPVAYSLYRKGAKLSVIFTYIGASGLCRIVMTTFEISFMGLKFTLIRLFVSLPLVIIFSICLGNYLKDKNYQITEG
jgi:uncharacterized membrane protein YraQ (UPF0718 family)